MHCDYLSVNLLSKIRSYSQIFTQLFIEMVKIQVIES